MMNQNPFASLRIEEVRSGEDALLDDVEFFSSERPTHVYGKRKSGAGTPSTPTNKASTSEVTEGSANDGSTLFVV